MKFRLYFIKHYVCTATLLHVLFLTWGQQEVITEHFRVIFFEPTLETYAQEVAVQAEKALEVLSTYFSAPIQRIVITVNNNTDIYNGFASPLPRPRISIRALFPNAGGLGFGSKSELFFLLIHELTHVQQLRYTEQAEGNLALPQLGLVGQNTARVPPMWFLEGLAVWIESEHSEAGRRDDAMTRGLLHTLAQSDNFPSLEDVSLETFDNWPGGNARYLLGASFLDYLIDQYGFESILALLRDFNAGFLDGFASSWARVIRTSLFDEWQNWQVALREEAQKKLFQQDGLLTATASYTRSPAFSPDGQRLAWVSMPSKIVLADWNGSSLQNQRTLIDRRFAETLDWLDDQTLIYSRVVRRPGTEFLELFALDIVSGQEIQLTQGARAHMPRATPKGCILFVRDLPQEDSQLQEFCAGEITTLWKAPEATHIVGLDVSAIGQIVISLWDQGHVDLALLKNGNLSFLTQDDFQDLYPVFQDEGILIFSSDRSGTFELYRLSLQDGILETLTQSLGGAFQSTATASSVIYASLGASGYDLAVLEQLEFEPIPRLDVQTAFQDIIEPSGTAYEVRRYSPEASMKPYGWVPDFGVSLSPLGLKAGVSILSLDDTLQHSLSMNLAYDTTLEGHLYGATVYGSYRYHENSVFNSLLPPYPWSVGLKLGIWEHRGHLMAKRETALGTLAHVATTSTLDRWILRSRLELGLVHLPSFAAFQPDARADISISQLASDDWRYHTRGQRFGLSSVWSATDQGASFGLWTDALYYQPLPPGTLELSLRAGYRQPPMVSLDLGDWSAVGLVGYRLSLPVQWRIDDGVYALERLTFEPRVRPYFDGRFRLAADLTLSADAVLGYGAPVSLSMSLGYAQGFWYGLAWKLPL